MYQRKLISLAMTMALLASCATPLTPTGAVSGAIRITSADALKKATVNIYDRTTNKLLATGKVNDSGQFLVSGVPIGDVRVVVTTSQNSESADVAVESGRITELPLMRMTHPVASASQPQVITGKILDKDGRPLAGATVTDVTGGEASAVTTTDNDGSFSLTVTNLDKAKTLEIAKDNLVRTTTVTGDRITGLTVTLIPNVRSVSGTVSDAAFSDRKLANLIVKVSGTDIATTTGADGRFALRGVPFDRATIEFSGLDGYTNSTRLLDAGRDNVDNFDHAIQPFGNVVVHLTSESAPWGDGLGSMQDQIRAFPSSFQFFDRDGDGNGANYTNPVNPGDFNPSEWRYHNDKGAVTPLEGTITVEGTNIVQDFVLPPAEEEVIMSLPSVNAPAIEMGRIRKRNFFITVPFRGVPGGRQNLTISLAGHEIQKSISVVVPPLDTVSTDMITLRRLRENITVGDIKGKILGVDAADMTSIRVGYVPAGYSIDMSIAAKDPSKPMILSLNDVLTSPVYSSSADANGNYHLSRVPSGSRIVVAGVDDGAGGYYTKYVPNTASLLNVVGGVVNTAPDLTLSKR